MSIVFVRFEGDASNAEVKRWSDFNKRNELFRNPNDIWIILQLNGYRKYWEKKTLHICRKTLEKFHFPLLGFELNGLQPMTQMLILENQNTLNHFKETHHIQILIYIAFLWQWKDWKVWMDQLNSSYTETQQKRKQIDSSLENHLYYLIFPWDSTSSLLFIDISFVAFKQWVYRLHKESSFNSLAYTCKCTFTPDWKWIKYR